MTPFNQATKSPLFADLNRVHEHVVSPGFFATYGQDSASGRDFDRRDSPGSPRVAVVSESYVAKFLRGRIRSDATLDSGACDQPRGPCAVVGVVTDAVFGPLRSGPRPTIYFPLAQSAGLGPPGPHGDCAQRAIRSRRPALLGNGVADALTSLIGRLSFSNRPLEQDVASGADPGATAGRIVGVLCRSRAAAGGPRPLRRDRACRAGGAPRSASVSPSGRHRCACFAWCSCAR